MVYAGVSYGASEHAGEDRPPAGGRAHALLGFDDSQAACIEPARGEREERPVGMYVCVCMYGIVDQAYEPAYSTPSILLLG